MKCPKCGNEEDKVLDSRLARDGAAIRRRRECLQCGCRFTTHEEIDRDDLYVVKRDGKRELFSREKLERSIHVACQKRPVSEPKIQAVVDKIIAGCTEDEVTTEYIGNVVMQELHGLDEVAYIRFASVYRRFQDVKEFLAAITEIVKK